MKRNKEKIYVSGPSITKLEEKYVLEAVRNAWYDDANYYNNEFEEKVASYVDRKYAVSLPSCTSGIHLILEAIGVKQGDEVLIPDLTWIASAAPICYRGATPVFVDVHKKTWCIDENEIQKNITEKTKAILAVDLYGNMPAYEKIMDIAETYHIPVIEDAAEAMGSTYKGRRAGNFGIASVFSFHGSKMLTTGEGGMLLTDDETLYQRCLKMRDHGRKQDTSKMFWNDEIGYKYKMSSLQAALGVAQMERVNELVEMKNRIFKWYQEEIGYIEGIQLNTPGNDVTSNYWMVTMVLDNSKYDIPKEKVMEYFKSKNIDTRPVFYRLSELPAFDGKKNNRNKTAENIAKYGVNLPSDINITKEEVRKVCVYLRQLLCV